MRDKSPQCLSNADRKAPDRHHRGSVGQSEHQNLAAGAIASISVVNAAYVQQLGRYRLRLSTSVWCVGVRGPKTLLGAERLEGALACLDLHCFEVHQAAARRMNPPTRLVLSSICSKNE